MGIRALIEHVMIQQCGDEGTFAKNIDKFAKDGFISPTQRSFLEIVLEAGHATIHRAYSPKIADLHTCLDLAENLVETLYILPSKVSKLKEGVPNRNSH